MRATLTLLCIATYRKGDEFLKECRRQGCRVLLLTEEKLRDGDWPRDTDVVEAATGVNLWREWAKIEMAGAGGSYTAPGSRGLHAGIVLSLARQEHPDLSAYDDPEIVTRIRKRHHAGLIVSSPHHTRIADLIERYVQRFYADFHASAPPLERAIE